MKIATRIILSLIMVSALMMPVAVSASSEATADDHIVSVTAITQVFGDGMKASAAAIEYDADIDPDSVSAEDYTIDGHEIIAAFVSSEAELTEESGEGPFVIVLLDTSTVQGSNYVGMGGGASGGRGKRASGEMSSSSAIELTVVQTGEIATADGQIYAGSDTEYVTAAEENINLVFDDFQQLVFESEYGDFMYNFYVPADYDENESYPMVLFMPDATGNGSNPVKTLIQGNGAIIWAEPENQEENTCFVLAPQFEDTVYDVEMTFELIDKLLDEFSIDPNRLYVTGQSAGTIRAITMMIEQPDRFAAAMLVAGQAENGYENRISELSGQTIWMIASTGDVRALPGMTAIMEAVAGKGTETTEGAWSAKLPIEEQNAEAEAMTEAGTSFYFTVLDDVLPEGAEDSDATWHMNTWRVAYEIDAIRAWVFEQSK